MNTTFLMDGNIYTGKLVGNKIIGIPQLPIKSKSYDIEVTKDTFIGKLDGTLELHYIKIIDDRRLK